MAEPDVVEQALERARSALAPSAAERARLRAALVSPSGAASRASNAWAALKLPGPVGLGIGLAIAGGGFFAGYALRDAPTAAEVSPSAFVATPPASRAGEAPAPSALAETTAPAVPTPAAASAPPSPARAPQAAIQRAPRARSSVAPAPVPGNGTGDELGVLQSAQRAIAKGDGPLALSLLAALGTSAQAALAEERDAARAMALCLMQDPSARSTATAFALAQPQSIYLDRVRALCSKSMR